MGFVAHWWDICDSMVSKSPMMQAKSSGAGRVASHGVAVGMIGGV